jgi:Spy/CpxP family protein refolding chaperone
MIGRRNKISAAVVALLALLVVPRAAAQVDAPAVSSADRAAQERRQRAQSGADQSELMRALDLTAEQRARIAAIRRETEERARLDNARVRRARRALEEAIYAESADESLIDARSREVAEAEAARVRARADAELKVRRVLKPEQLGTFRELRRRAMLDARRQRRDALRDGLRPGARRLPRERRQPAQGVVAPNANAQTVPAPPRRQIEPGRRPRP